ncbi:MAG: autotransporter-associated beta strand repeat-containing protein [Kiritimatiellaeota bacterium]|nr:autotransporter-associated beta strand repeat-containing protein [Kiritimatiellota bacterium]
MNVKRVVLGCAAALAVSGAVAQQDVQWVGPTTGGLYSEGSNWATGQVPGVGQKGCFTQNGAAYIITFPQDFTNDVGMTEVTLSEGKITFDTRGTSWVKPTSADLVTDHTFRLRNGGHGFNLEGTGNGLLQFGLIDAVLTAEMGNNALHTTLESGLFNIYDATGVDDSGTRLVFAHDGGRSHYVTWKEGSASRIRQVDFRGSGPENIFFYEGGEHTVFGNFGMMCWDPNGRTGLVHVTGGLLDVRGTFNVCAKTTTTGIVKIDGGEVRANNLSLATDAAGKTTAAVEMTGGLLTVGSSLSIANTALSEASFTLDGGAVTVNGENRVGERGTGTVEMVSGSWLTRGSTLIGLSGDSAGRVTLSGGSMTATNSVVSVGNTLLAEGEFLVTGGAHRLRELTMARDGGKGYAELAGGEVTVSLIVTTGNGAASTNSVFAVSGGRHSVTGMDGIAVGRAGMGYAEITGGETDCHGYVRIGYGGANYDGYDPQNDTARISCLRMTGGTLRVLAGYPVNVADNENNSGRLVLEGGTLHARHVRGWYGSAGKSGNGYSELVADGGRVVPLTAVITDSAFMETFDLALLGDAGLTVDTDGRPAKINQAFGPKPGTRGRLVKAGLGTLYLNGQSTIGDIDVIGGTLAVQAADVFSGVLTVTNGATLSLLECGGLTLEGLTLGDASFTGRLMMGNNDTVAITAPGGLEAVNAWVYLSDPSSNGAYTLFACAGTVTLQDIAGLDMGNGLITKDYVWSVVPAMGGTEVVLTVSDRAVSAPIVWAGSADSLWDVPGNWLSGPPVRGSQASFPGSASRKAVSVTPGAVTGEMAFDSEAGYTLSGETLTLDNSGRVGHVAVEQGAHQIAAPLLLKRNSAFDISEGGALALDEVRGDGALVKDGTGLAVLNGADGFTGGFTVQDGTLALTSAAAFGEPSPDSERWTLAGGTLRYDGPSAARDNSIAINTGPLGADDGAVIIDIAAGGLTLNGKPNATKGVLIKRGAGTLTFNVSGTGSTLSVNNGKAGGNSQQPEHLIAFAGNGQAPLGGYSGFNIAEGKVRITSADASTEVSMRNAASIGLRTLDGAADPVLEIDHCRVIQGGGSLHCYIGGRTAPNAPLNNPLLRVVNGGYLWSDTFQFGNDASGEVNPGLFVDASNVEVGYAVNVSQPNGGVTSITLTNKAEFRINGNNINFNRPFRFEADDSLLHLNSGGDGLIHFNTDAHGTFTLRNGARARYHRLLVQGNAQVLLAFDGGTLEPRVNDRVLAFRGDNSRQTVELLNDGLTLDIADGMTHTLARNMEGNGALRKAGDGTLVFAGLMQEAVVEGELEYTPLGAPIDDYTGGTWVDAGTLAVSNGAIRTDRRITIAQDAALELNDVTAVGTLAGTGTIVGGALTQGTLSPGMADGETGSLNLQGTTLAGVTFKCDIEQDLDKTTTASDKLLNVSAAANVTVDFGRTSIDPILTPCSIPIGTYDPQNPPTVSTWKVKGIGRSGTIGEVTANDGTLTVNIRFGGFILLIR